MSRHEGVSCDSCLKGNFRGRRYKCLICFDYDCCATCYENGVTSNRHTTDHPMQCILTRNDFDLFYGGESLHHEFPQSYTCPFCGRMGLTETGLHDHVSSDHSDSSTEVICAICASIPGGEANNVTDDFAAHLTLEHHRPSDSGGGRHTGLHASSASNTAAAVARSSVAASLQASVPESSGGRDPSLEEPQTAIRGRRAPHPSRSSLTSNRSSRRQISQYSSTGGSSLSTLSPGTRDMDPISELLSQLSGVRRAANNVSSSAVNSTASQLQQLQMQLQLERHSTIPSLSTRQGFVAASSLHPSSSSNERVPIERVIRRQQQPSSSTGIMSSSQNNSSSQHHQQQLAHQAQLMSAAAAAVSGAGGYTGSYLMPDMPYIVLMDQNPMSSTSGNSIDSHVGIIGSAPSNTATAGLQLFASSSSGMPSLPVASSLATGSTAAVSGGASSSYASRFLLSRCNDLNLTDSEQASLEVLKADKALFVQELIATTLSEDFSIQVCLEETESEASTGSIVTPPQHPSLQPSLPTERPSTSEVKQQHEQQTSVTEEKEEEAVAAAASEDQSVDKKGNETDKEFQLPVTPLLWMTPETVNANGVVTTTSNVVSPSAAARAAGGVTKTPSMAASGPETPLKLRSKSHPKAFEKV